MENPDELKNNHYKLRFKIIETSSDDPEFRVHELLKGNSTF